MHPRHECRRRFSLAMQIGDLMVVPCGLDRKVALPAVGVHGTPDFDGLLDKWNQTPRGGILDLPHSDSSDPRSIFLRCDDNQCLVVCLPPASTFLQASQIRLVHFDPTRQTVAARSDHRSTQLVEPSPGCLIAPQSEDPLQPQGTGAILLRCHPVHGTKPIHQRLARVLENRTRRYRGLMAALAALV